MKNIVLQKVSDRAKRRGVVVVDEDAADVLTTFSKRGSIARFQLPALAHQIIPTRYNGTTTSHQLSGVLRPRAEDFKWAYRQLPIGVGLYLEKGCPASHWEGSEQGAAFPSQFLL